MWGRFVIQPRPAVYNCILFCHDHQPLLMISLCVNSIVIWREQISHRVGKKVLGTRMVELPIATLKLTLKYLTVHRMLLYYNIKD